jgi:hypothetical protein
MQAYQQITCKKKKENKEYYLCPEKRLLQIKEQRADTHQQNKYSPQEY